MQKPQNKKHKLLTILAHPDDESFGPGGTMAKYADEGVEVYLVTATRGESGNIHPDLQNRFDGDLGKWRTQELKQAAKILGVKELIFLDFVDGTLSQNLMKKLIRKITNQIIRIKPQVVITFEPLGISRHLDHIAVSHATTLSFYRANDQKYLKANKIQGKPHQVLKLFHYVVPQSYIDKLNLKLRSGYPDEKITTIIDIKKYFHRKIKALACHQSQKQNWERFLKRQKKVDLKYEFYHRAESLITDYDGHETDLFEGIDNPERYKNLLSEDHDALTLG